MSQEDLKNSIHNRLNIILSEFNSNNSGQTDYTIGTHAECYFRDSSYFFPLYTSVIHDSSQLTESIKNHIKIKTLLGGKSPHVTIIGKRGSIGSKEFLKITTNYLPRIIKKRGGKRRRRYRRSRSCCTCQKTIYIILFVFIVFIFLLLTSDNQQI